MVPWDQQFLYSVAYLMPLTHDLWVNRHMFDPLALLFITNSII
jgi:hypothetical protein